MNTSNALPLAVVTAALLSAPAVPAQDSAVPHPRLPDNEAQSRARAALRDGSQAPATSAMDPTASTVRSFEEPVVSTLPGPQPDTESQARARAALREGWAMTTPEPSTAVVEAIVTEESTSALPAPVSAQPGAPHPFAADMGPPALPITAAQQRQLDALLARYRADELSASEYHHQRASVLAGN